MEDIEKYLTKWDAAKLDKLDNIISDSLQNFTKDYQKINIYNNGLGLPLQKIWLLTPKLKIFKFSYKNRNIITNPNCVCTT